MLGDVAPGLHSGLVAEERDREHLAFLGQALEPLHRNEPVDLFQVRAQLRRDIEIVVAAGRPDLEDHGDHRNPHYSTRRRNVRSSARMKRSFSANWKFATPSASLRSRAR